MACCSRRRRVRAPNFRPSPLWMALTLVLPPVIGHAQTPPTAAAAASAPAPTSTAQAVRPGANTGTDTQLKEIVVSASGFEQAIKEAPASISVITREELQQKRASSLTQVLEDVEGIDVGDTAGKTGGLNISIRGMPSDYTLVLVDGRRQNAAGNITPNGFGESSTSFLPPVSAIERIEVIRGPMATLYGSDAMGGVINIITRKVSKAWGGSVGTELTLQGESGFGDTRKFEAYVSGPLVPDLLGLTVRASSFHRDAADLQPTGTVGSTTTISTRGPAPVEADIHNIGARLTLTPNRNHDLWLDVEEGRQTYDNSQGQLGTLDNPGATRPTYNGYTTSQKFNQSQTTLAHTARLGWGTLDTSLLHASRETLGRTIPPGTPGVAPGSQRTLEATNTILDSKLVMALGEQHMLTVGGQWWDAKMVDGVAPAPYEHRQWALYGENEWRIRNNLAITLGLRHDDHSTFGGQTSPRVYGVWNPTDNWTLKGGISRGYKTPRLDQLASGITGFTGQGTRPTIGTPTLTPETSTTTEIGAYYDNLAGFTGNISVFNNEFKNKIASGPGLLNCSFAGQPNRPGCVDYGNWPAVDEYGQLVNIDSAVTRGMEVAFRMPINAAWGISGNYTHTRSEIKSGADQGQPLTNTPRHMLNASLRWKATPALNTWLKAEYRASRYRGAGAAQDALGDHKGYGLLHLGGSYTVNKALTLNATVYNLLNKDFLEYGSYQGTPTTANPSGLIYSSLYNNMLEGRRLWVSANLAF